MTKESEILNAFIVQLEESLSKIPSGEPTSTFDQMRKGYNALILDLRRAEANFEFFMNQAKA